MKALCCEQLPYRLRLKRDDISLYWFNAVYLTVLMEPKNSYNLYCVAYLF